MLTIKCSFTGFVNIKKEIKGKKNPKCIKNLKIKLKKIYFFNNYFIKRFSDVSVAWKYHDEYWIFGNKNIAPIIANKNESDIRNNKWEDSKLVSVFVSKTPI